MAEETEEGKHKFIFTWSIENFSCSLLKKGELLCSPPFCIDVILKTEWILEINPSGYKSDKYVSLFLQRQGTIVDSMRIGYELQILNSKGIPEISKTIYDRFFGTNVGFGFWEYISTNDLYVIKRKHLLPNDCLTLRARIWKYHGSLLETSHCFARTRMHKEPVSFFWTIEECSSITAETEKTITAPMTSEKSPRITVALSPCPSSENLKFVVTVNDSEQFKVINASISLVDDKDNKVHTKEGEILLDASNGASTWTSNCFYRTELWSGNKGRFGNDTLRFRFSFDALKGDVVYEAIENLVSGPDALEQERSSSMRLRSGEEPEEYGDPKMAKGPDGDAELLNCLRARPSSDVSGRFAERRHAASRALRYPAHRAHLSARSPVFRAMFASDMREGTEGTVRIEDMDGDTLRRLLDFIYTDSACDMRVETAADLYTAADKYQVPLLRRRCSEFLVENVCADNASGLLVLADAHGDDGFKSSVVSFVVEHCAEVCDTESWRSLMKTQPSLAAEVMYQRIISKGP